ncbi:MAG: D-tyrosyl-tRNA(Tyr) deacylase [Lewinellaceae bacterium]|nr:D-tyrosyl-tRNA(Tyr) deacylase [Saprospiraceae bacterium]MCB9312945.1 D-tyrosyl-tRNA(Tyr) deacylase [Lewinellaceae bacterium]HRW74374.1 D-aminoacyl-tRNA deacylase [Saprospiraceae bacterium]
MRALLQRVKEASVHFQHEPPRSIGPGLLILLGIESSDNREDVEWLVGKISQIRIFADEEGKMNLDIRQSNGSILVISQFTLHASTRKGNRPSFIRAARPEQAVPLYEYFIEEIQRAAACTVICGIFGADMQVRLQNDGPVTLMIDSQNRE